MTRSHGGVSCTVSGTRFDTVLMTLLLIDLDRPARGIIRVRQDSMHELLEEPRSAGGFQR